MPLLLLQQSRIGLWVPSRFRVLYVLCTFQFQALLLQVLRHSVSQSGLCLANRSFHLNLWSLRHIYHELLHHPMRST